MSNIVNYMFSYVYIIIYTLIHLLNRIMSISNRRLQKKAALNLICIIISSGRDTKTHFKPHYFLTGDKLLGEGEF